jgi:hypothetical protein
MSAGTLVVYLSDPRDLGMSRASKNRIQRPLAPSRVRITMVQIMMRAPVISHALKNLRRSIYDFVLNSSLRSYIQLLDWP